MRTRMHRVAQRIERNFAAFADVPYMIPLLDEDEQPNGGRSVHSQFYESRQASISPTRVKSSPASWLTLQHTEAPMRPNAQGRSAEESL
jgi:hypothetical protein